MDEHYFSISNKSIASYYWAGFLYKKQSFYKKGKNYYLKLRIRKDKKDLMYKFLASIKLIKIIKENNRRGGIVTLNIKANTWKVDLINNYSLPFEINNETRKYAIAFIAGWSESCSIYRYTKYNKPGNIQLPLKHLKDNNHLNWFKLAFKKLFFINIKESLLYRMTPLEKEFYLNTIFMTLGKYDLLSDITIKYYNDYFKFKTSNSS